MALFGNLLPFRDRTGNVIMSVSETDNKMVSLSPRPAAGDHTGSFPWPVLGILAALFCTILWCAFLIWLFT